MGVINIILCVILVCHIGTYRCNGVQINIDPPKTIATTVNDIHISCLPDVDEDNEKQLTLIELSRNDQDTIVFVSHCGNVSFGHDSSNKFQAIGHIGKVSSQSYLNVTLVNPESQDTGIYTCIMVYLNTEGHLETETASGNLLVENLDVKALEGVLNKMKDRITSLEKEIQEKDSELVEKLNDEKATKMINNMADKITSLEKANTNQSLEFSALKDKVFYNTMFMAMDKNGKTTESGKVIVFPNLIRMVGTGYDEKTGVFTAPVAGVYVFNLVVLAREGCFLNVFLKVNDKIISRSFAYDKDKWAQSTINSAVELQAGDRAFCTSRDACEVHSGEYTVFTGYLVKAL